MTDDNKTTPTPAPGLDLDAVERAERAMTAGPWPIIDPNDREPGPPVWHGSNFGGVTAIGPIHYDSDEDETQPGSPAHLRAEADSRGIVALRNAAPALIAEVRALRAAAEEREADMHARIRAGYDKTVADAWRAEVAKRDAEIADLRANLAAARAVPADVEAAIAATNYAIDRDEAADKLRAAFARAISDATAARVTVGGLLATAPVGSIVEFWHGATANQITTRVGGIDDRVWLWRYRNPNGEWSPWDYEAPSPDDLSQPGEIVPADPNQRGPLPKGG